MSTKDERILFPGDGRYPFRVSDEYFENLTARIMDRIPEDKGNDSHESVGEKNGELPKAQLINIGRKRNQNVWIRTISIAASLALLAVVTLKFIPTDTTKTNTEELTAEYTDDDYNEDLMTYTMADNMAVYEYLSEYGNE